MIQLLLCMLIPNYQLMQLEPNQVEWISYMTKGTDIVLLKIVLEELIFRGLQ